MRLGYQVVVQCLGFTKELRAKQDVVAMVLLTHRRRKAHRNRRLDDYDSIRVVGNDQPNNFLHCRSVEEVLLAVVIRGRSHDHEVSVLVGCCAIQRGHQVQFFLRQILLNILVLNGADAVVDFVYLLRDDVHGGHMVVLRQQHRNGKPHIASTGQLRYSFALLLLMMSIVSHCPASLRQFMSMVSASYRCMKTQSLLFQYVHDWVSSHSLRIICLGRTPDTTLQTPVSLLEC